MEITLTYNFGGEHYYYYHEVVYEDITDYLTPSGKDLEMELTYQAGIIKVIREFGINADNVENDEYFIKYLHEKYKDLAKEKYESEKE